MDVAITGASGLIGTALRSSLEADGHRVAPLVRPGGSGRGIAWNPDTGTIDAGGLEGLDAVVHLAGAGVASGRWTEEHKEAVLQSRVQGTTLLAEALAGLRRPPRVFVSGSAIGYYGSRGDEVLGEESPPGYDFLSSVCVAWEAATATAEDAGIRTLHIRTGIVLSAEGGALGAQRLPFRWGSAAKEQYENWTKGARQGLSPTRRSQQLRTLNPSHYLDYQDCQYVGHSRMLCTGVTRVSADARRGAVPARRSRSRSICVMAGRCTRCRCSSGPRQAST